MKENFRIPLRIQERHGLHRAAEAVRVGVPLPRALVRDPGDVAVSDEQGRVLRHQAVPLAHWPDCSIKWLLVDALAEIQANSSTYLFLTRGPASSVDREPPGPELRIRRREAELEIDTGAACFALSSQFPGFTSIHVGGVNVLADLGSNVRVTGKKGLVLQPSVTSLTIEESGPLRATVLVQGVFRRDNRRPVLDFRSRSVFIAGSSAVRIEFLVRNPRAALHAGGLWDLGDPGSFYIEDLSAEFQLRKQPATLRWCSEFPDDQQEIAADSWLLYQDSSGGVNWDSPNHVDQHSELTVSFRGYRVRRGVGGEETEISRGDRATPYLMVMAENAWLAMGMKDFWQNFPKALRWRDGVLGIGLLPSESAQAFELQGGEQKRHTLFLECGTKPDTPRIVQLQHPVAAAVDPRWIEGSEALLWFSAASAKDDPIHAAYVSQIIDGPDSFFAKRELIDEYGWRNFGDLYADHESHKSAVKPFISHYNNQYDFIYGAFVHALRSGDSRWHVLMADLARHVIDIDIYHTQEDRAVFNGGLFWHTDHYKPAATCTHRTYSRVNGGRSYGGGPSNEHNYTSGLLHYHYLTGDREAANAVLELATWVLAMDDGSRTLFALIDDGPTGAASKTLETSFHRPGRGAGNSINAVIDAYALCRDRKFLAKAEELILRCVHPDDDIEALALDEPEYRWSYLVFFQVLGKYLALKSEMHEIDYCFHYARESLLHYAEWIADHEVAYGDVLHKVEFPTETWPAHDVRKCHVLHVAAEYADEALRARFTERATFFFQRCMRDLLAFPTSHFTRPRVIVAVFGSVHDYFQQREGSVKTFELHKHDFGEPSKFIPQRSRLQARLKANVRAVVKELARLVREKLHVLRVRAGGVS